MLKLTGYKVLKGSLYIEIEETFSMSMMLSDLSLGQLYLYRLRPKAYIRDGYRWRTYPEYYEVSCIGARDTRLDELECRVKFELEHPELLTEPTDVAVQEVKNLFKKYKYDVPT